MEIETDKSSISVWLVKLPSFLAEKIAEITGEQTIGEILISPSAKDAPATIQFQLSQELISQGLPVDYSLSFTDKTDKLYVLKDDGDRHRVEGALVKRPPSTIKVINYLREGRQSEKFGSVSELEYLARKRKKILQAKKRERLEKNEVIDILFKAFEKYPAWTARDLADFSGQPVAFIQEILPEICVLNKKDYKNLYELKPEYKYSDA
ncbi:UNVERIFIED_CONTAM: hypothetical protein PYX00_011708 [Menopon gallinae]|uniref:General transcription factor IIF subunit 2 n=1 Tax=Menopon gallinae TaxID=328185 RepID=A0AAW2H8E3_9NEOP